MQTTKHTHQVIFGRKVEGCPRCTELKLGMPARKWNNYRASSEASRLAEIREHYRNGQCSCGPVCVKFEW